MNNNIPRVSHLKSTGFFLYHDNLTFKQFYVLPTQCFVWISEQTAIISLYSIDWLVFITEMDSLNEVIPLCIDSIYSLSYIYSSQHNYKTKA